MVENLLESKFVSMIAKKGSVGGLANKFNSEVELLDDLNDHWCASSHKKERNWLVEEFQRLAVDSRVRVSFVSGDVHAASISKFHTTKKHVEPPKDPKYMLQVRIDPWRFGERTLIPPFLVQIVSSAIVNTPPPNAVIQMVATFGKKRHKVRFEPSSSSRPQQLNPRFSPDPPPCRHGRDSPPHVRDRHGRHAAQDYDRHGSQELRCGQLRRFVQRARVRPSYRGLAGVWHDQGLPD